MADDYYDRICSYPCNTCEPEVKTCVCGEHYDSEEPEDVADHKECKDVAL